MATRTAETDSVMSPGGDRETAVEDSSLALGGFTRTVVPGNG